MMGSSSEDDVSPSAAGQSDYGLCQGPQQSARGGRWLPTRGCPTRRWGKWRSRFLELRLDGLSDEPRSGRLRAVTDDNVEHVLTLTLETTPKYDAHWSTRSTAAA